MFASNKFETYMGAENTFGIGLVTLDDHAFSASRKSSGEIELSCKRH